MATASVTPAPAPPENGFQRFIDKIGALFIKAQPAINTANQLAVDAETFLALTPYGPEYDLVVNAVVGAEKTGAASLAAGTALTGAQKMALVLQAVAPGLSSILASKKVTSGIPAAIQQFAQNVYNLQTGPFTTVPPSTAAPAATA